MSELIRMGIIVIGSMSTGHARHVVERLCTDFVLCAVADCNPAHPERAKDKLGDSVVFFSEALAMECMRRGIHAMVEKPAGV